jgi:hypothetical protein
MNNDDPLDTEIDFSKGVRGKFYRPGMKLRIPVYLEETLLRSLAEIAEGRGKSGRTGQRFTSAGPCNCGRAAVTPRPRTPFSRAREASASLPKRGGEAPRRHRL